MGRKTNSVSLRLKKTNKDFNDCWYGDILYSENVSKSLKIKGLFSQILKSAAVPCAYLSLIGAFKKSNIFVGYLDPETTRKRRCESFYLKMYPRLPDNKSDVGVLANQNLKTHKSFCKSNSKKSTKEKPLQFLIPNTIAGFADCKVVAQQKQETGHIVHKAPLGLISGCSQDISRTFQSRGLILPKLYKRGILFPQNSTLSENFISMFSKTTQIQLQSNCFVGQNRTVPIENCFHLIEFLYSVKAAFKYLGTKEYTKIENKVFYWFSQRNSIFCLLQSKSKIDISSESSLAFNHTLLQSNSKQDQEKEAPLNLVATQTFSKALTKPLTLRSKALQSKQELFFAKQNHEKKIQDFGVIASKEPTTVVALQKQNQALFLLPSNNGFFAVQEATALQSKVFKHPFLESAVTDFGPQSIHVEKINPYLGRLQSLYSRFWGNFLCISFYKSINEQSSALFLANSIAYYLERRVLFRRLKRQLLLELSTSTFHAKNLKKTKNKEKSFLNTVNSGFSMLDKNVSQIAGIRVCCSGRVGGRSKKAQRSRKETLMWGETGLHVFSSKLDFARTQAETGFGLVGIQVWICYK